MSSSSVSFPVPSRLLAPLARPALRSAPGLLLAGAIALAATEAARAAWLQAHGIGALTLAIVLGMLAGNLVPGAAGPVNAGGIDLARQRFLRLGIVLYGLRLTFQDIAHVGIAGVAIDATVLCSTFALACIVGVRVFGLDLRTAMLIGAGSSICGAAAVMATGPVVRGRSDQVAVAVATVVVFGTLAIFLYPALYGLNLHGQWVALSPSAYGVYAGSTIHEVAQVVAAGHAVGNEAADTAVIAKMVRVMMLAPFLVGLSAWLALPSGTGAAAPGAARARITIPWFALGFVALAGVHSLRVLPEPLVGAANTLDVGLLTIAMAALGVTTRVAAIRDAGLRPLALAALLFAWLVVGGGAINLGLGALLGRA
jgi:uncharacterized integral membrane protein (TIGR00698 family)